MGNMISCCAKKNIEKNSIDSDKNSKLKTESKNDFENNYSKHHFVTLKINGLSDRNNTDSKLFKIDKNISDRNNTDPFKYNEDKNSLNYEDEINGKVIEDKKANNSKVKTILLDKECKIEDNSLKKEAVVARDNEKINKCMSANVSSLNKDISKSDKLNIINEEDQKLLTEDMKKNFITKINEDQNNYISQDSKNNNDKFNDDTQVGRKFNKQNSNKSKKNFDETSCNLSNENDQKIEKTINSNEKRENSNLKNEETKNDITENSNDNIEISNEKIKDSIKENCENFNQNLEGAKNEICENSNPKIENSNLDIEDKKNDENEMIEIPNINIEKTKNKNFENSKLGTENIYFKNEEKIKEISENSNEKIDSNLKLDLTKNENCENLNENKENINEMIRETKKEIGENSEENLEIQNVKNEEISENSDEKIENSNVILEENINENCENLKENKYENNVEIIKENFKDKLEIPNEKIENIKKDSIENFIQIIEIFNEKIDDSKNDLCENSIHKIEIPNEKIGEAIKENNENFKDNLEIPNKIIGETINEKDENLSENIENSNERIGEKMMENHENLSENIENSNEKNENLKNKFNCENLNENIHNSNEENEETKKKIIENLNENIQNSVLINEAKYKIISEISNSKLKIHNVKNEEIKNEKFENSNYNIEISNENIEEPKNENYENFNQNIENINEKIQESIKECENSNEKIEIPIKKIDDAKNNQNSENSIEKIEILYENIGETIKENNENINDNPNERIEEKIKENIENFNNYLEIPNEKIGETMNENNENLNDNIEALENEICENSKENKEESKKVISNENTENSKIRIENLMENEIPQNSNFKICEIKKDENSIENKDKIIKEINDIFDENLPKNIEVIDDPSKKDIITNEIIKIENVLNNKEIFYNNPIEDEIKKEIDENSKDKIESNLIMNNQFNEILKEKEEDNINIKSDNQDQKIHSNKEIEELNENEGKTVEISEILHDKEENININSNEFSSENSQINQVDENVKEDQINIQTADKILIQSKDFENESRKNIDHKSYNLHEKQIVNENNSSPEQELNKPINNIFKGIITENCNIPTTDNVVDNKLTENNYAIKEVIKNVQTENIHLEYSNSKKKTIFIDSAAKNMMEKRKSVYEKAENIYKNVIPDLKEKSISSSVLPTNEKIINSSRENNNPYPTLDSEPSANTILLSEESKGNENPNEKKRNTVMVNPSKTNIIPEDKKDDNIGRKRKTSVVKSNQKLLIAGSAKQERVVNSCIHKFNLSLALEDNQIEAELSIALYSKDNHGNQTLLGNITKKTGKHISFDQKFIIDYSFHTTQFIHIVISSDTLNDDFTTSLEQILANPNNDLTIKHDKFKLLLKAEIIHNNEKEVFSVFSVKFAFKLISMNSKFLTFKMWIFDSKKKDEGNLLYESEEKGSQKIFQFCDAMIKNDIISNKNNRFIIEIHEKKTLIGKTNYIDFKQLKTKKIFDLFDSKSKEIPQKLEVAYSERKAKNFIDYLNNGLRLKYLIAIDFTSSNIEFSNKDSLHNIDNQNYNDYEKIIMKFGQIFEKYEKDCAYSVYGFGGIPPEKDEVSHCFYVNLKNEPIVNGLSSVIENYRTTLSKIKFFGPTYFRYFVKNMIEMVRKSVSINENIYHISLILTDGLMNDMEETIDLFVEASKLPISFIIIGVGNGDFENMNILDRTKFTLYNTKGEKALRDAVQFAIYNEFKTEEEFVEACLKELPNQIEEFFHYQTSKS